MPKYQKLLRHGLLQHWTGGKGGGEVCSVNVHQLSSLGWIGLEGYVQDCR